MAVNWPIQDGGQLLSKTVPFLPAIIYIIYLYLFKLIIHQLFFRAEANRGLYARNLIFP